MQVYKLFWIEGRKFNRNKYTKIFIGAIPFVLLGLIRALINDDGIEVIPETLFKIINFFRIPDDSIIVPLVMMIIVSIPVALIVFLIRIINHKKVEMSITQEFISWSDIALNKRDITSISIRANPNFLMKTAKNNLNYCLVIRSSNGQINSFDSGYTTLKKILNDFVTFNYPVQSGALLDLDDIYKKNIKS